MLEDKIQETEKKNNQSGLLESLKDSYFKIRDFERSGTIYKICGAGYFSKYWINGGSFWKREGISATSTTPFKRAYPKSDLQSLITSTKMLESFHALAFPVYSAGIIMVFMKDEYGAAAVFAGLNFFINVLPIMGQRYNRARAERILNKRYGNKEEANSV